MINAARTPRLSPHDRRVLVRGVSVIILLLVVTRGVPAWRSWLRDSRGSAEALTSTLTRIEAGLPFRRALADTLRARSAQLVAIESTLLPGDSPAAAAASLSSLVSTAATAAEVRLGSLQVWADSAPATSATGGTATAPSRAASPAPYARVTVRADATGDIGGITAMLADLESDTLRIRLREVSITQPEPAAPATQPEALRMDFVIDGLARSTRVSRNEPNAVVHPAGAGRPHDEP